MDFSFKYGGRIYRKKDFDKEDDRLVCKLGNGVQVTAVIRDFAEFNALSWVLYFENTGKENSLLFSEIKDCDISYPCINAEKKRDGYRASANIPAVTCMNGMVYQDYYRRSEQISSEEFGLFTEYFFDESTPKHYENVGGRSSDRLMPFFDFHTKEDGIMLAIGWTGDWQLDAVRNDDELIIAAGLRNAEFYLIPGEKLRTASILLMEYHGSNAKNKFKRLLKTHFSHTEKYPHKPDNVTASMIWGSVPSEEMIKRVRNLKKHKIPIDTVWVDAGWYGTIIGKDTHGTEWGRNTGDWRANTVLHPNEMKDVAEVIKEEGLGFLLWVELERAVEGTPITVEHPDWFLRVEGEKNNLVLNLGKEEAWQYAFDLVDGLVRKLHLKVFRQDYNITEPSSTQYFSENDTTGRRGITEIKHIMGLYRLWDKLLEDHRDLVIDNCASGGRRFDIEALSRSIVLFRTDYLCLNNTNFDTMALHTAGASTYFPYHGASARDVTDLYNARCTYSPCWAICNYNYATQNPTDEEFDITRKTVTEYNRIQRYLSCDFYNLGTVGYDESGVGWNVFQYHDTDTDSGIVMAFRKENSPFPSANITLKGLKENYSYRFTNLDTCEAFNSNGEIEIVLPEKRTSVIFEYTSAK
ncbi:MAG: alpha-galactosidase [Clostridia bacterium]|nr:alpha-galactosidase [Clostridia bacterium]